MVVIRRFNPLIHHRRSIRLKGYDYSSKGGYFITFRCREKKPLLGRICNKKVYLTPAGEVVYKYWTAIPKRFPGVRLGAWIIMPDHLHGILIIEKSPPRTQTEGVEAIRQGPVFDQKKRRKMLIPLIVGWFKMNSAKEINILLHSSGNAFWEKNYYERIIRNETAYRTISWYIRTNPKRFKEYE